MKNLTNKFVQQDSVTKGGLIFVGTFIVPILTSMLYSVLFTNQVITFGGF
jgi:hypothetical protein